MSEKDGKVGSDERITQTGEDLGADLAQVGEIEVTEEMLEAGACAAFSSGWNPDTDSYEELAEIIYRAMMETKFRKPYKF